MLSLLAVLVLGIFTQQTFADEPEAIVGGTLALPGEFPYQVSLRVRGSHMCGGTIVSPTCIVTAAHCLDGVVSPPYTDIKIIAGVLSNRGGFERAVKVGKIHPNYRGESKYSWMYDAAVLVLEKPIEFNGYQSSIGLATERPRPGTQCIVSGWGKTNTTSPVSPDLRKANVGVIDNDTCRNEHAYQPIYDVHLCTFARYGVGACQGDSGGPLQCNGVLTGIVSWVRPCAVGLPDVFCNVAAVLDFIRSVCPAV